MGSDGSHLEKFRARAMARWDWDTSGIEQELTLHLERANDLSERARRANDAAQLEIERARAIAEELRDVSSESESRASELRHPRRGR
jgi:hypothetical protein